MSQNVEYNLRNANHYSLPNFRLQLSNSSFFPSTIRLWNNLDPGIRQSRSAPAFKNSLRKLNDINIPSYYLFGDRKSNILHARLRTNSSTLNDDLFHANLIDFQICHCGHSIENAFHFFFICNKYIDQRIKWYRELNDFIPLDLQLILHVSHELSKADNEKIFLHTQKYIHDTNRF